MLECVALGVFAGSASGLQSRQTRARRARRAGSTSSPVRRSIRRAGMWSCGPMRPAISVAGGQLRAACADGRPVRRSSHGAEPHPPNRTHRCVDRDGEVRLECVRRVRGSRPVSSSARAIDFQQVCRHQQGRAGPPVRAHLHAAISSRGSRSGLHRAAAAAAFPAVVYDPRHLRRRDDPRRVFRRWHHLGCRSVARRSIGCGVKVGVYAADNAARRPGRALDSVSLNAQSDEFAGTALEKCRWSQIVREAPTGYRVANGVLETRHGRRRGRRHRTEPDRPARPGRHLGGRDQARPHDDVAGPAGRPVALQGAGELDQGRARSHGRHHGTDRVRPRQGRRLPARRSVQCLRRHHAYIPLPADAGSTAARRPRSTPPMGRPGRRSARRATSPISAPATSARWRCAAPLPRRSRRSSTTSAFAPPGCSRRWASQAAPSASSARSTATRRTRCRRRRCRPRAP